ncbi:hypothetical protein ElyMa_000535900 [Elysia marginata]|uniref:Uncharacterized protein n=1 Tax=Elysia marginata TaxID=1093978 RepID=A0AAV4G1I5_9GAST|nr:hypothetical protein ElyMa_000535900 [Elysia marginata]
MAPHVCIYSTAIPWATVLPAKLCEWRGESVSSFNYRGSFLPGPRTWWRGQIDFPARLADMQPSFILRSPGKQGTNEEKSSQNILGNLSSIHCVGQRTPQEGAMAEATRPIWTAERNCKLL